MRGLGCVDSERIICLLGARVALELCLYLAARGTKGACSTFVERDLLGAISPERVFNKSNKC